jgi:hypothetical protein
MLAVKDCLEGFSDENSILFFVAVKECLEGFRDEDSVFLSVGDLLDEQQVEVAHIFKSQGSSVFPTYVTT